MANDNCNTPCFGKLNLKPGTFTWGENCPNGSVDMEEYIFHILRMCGIECNPCCIDPCDLVKCKEDQICKEGKCYCNNVDACNYGDCAECIYPVNCEDCNGVYKCLANQTCINNACVDCFNCAALDYEYIDEKLIINTTHPTILNYIANGTTVIPGIWTDVEPNASYKIFVTIVQSQGCPTCSEFVIDVPIICEGDLVVEKNSTLNGNWAVGTTVTYDFTVTNNSNCTITGITLDDSLGQVNGGPINLNSNQFNSSAFSLTYTLTQDDVNANELVNTVTASGVDEAGDPIVSNEDEDVITNDCSYIRLGTAVNEQTCLLTLTPTGVAPFVYPKEFTDLGSTATISLCDFKDGEITVVDANNCSTTSTVTPKDFYDCCCDLRVEIGEGNCVEGEEWTFEVPVTTSGLTIDTLSGVSFDGSTLVFSGNTLLTTQQVTFIDANGCTDTININIPSCCSKVSLTASIDTESCLLVLTPIGEAPFIYPSEFTDLGDTATLSLCDAESGTFIVTDADGCSMEDTVSLEEFYDCCCGLVVELGEAVCTEGNEWTYVVPVINTGLSIETLAGVTFDGTNLVFDTTTFESSQQVTFTDENGCKNTVTIDVPECDPCVGYEPLVVTHDITDCILTVTISGGSGEYGGSIPDVQESITDPTKTVYTANICDVYPEGEFSDTAIINDLNCPGVLATDTYVWENECCDPCESFQVTSSLDSSCGGTIEITSNGTAPLTYDWVAGQPALDLGDGCFCLNEGSYSVVVTDANGCTQEISGTIEDPSAPSCVSVPKSIVKVDNEVYSETSLDYSFEKIKPDGTVVDIDNEPYRIEFKSGNTVLAEVTGVVGQPISTAVETTSTGIVPFLSGTPHTNSFVQFDFPGWMIANGWTLEEYPEITFCTFVGGQGSTNCPEESTNPDNKTIATYTCPKDIAIVLKNDVNNTSSNCPDDPYLLVDTLTVSSINLYPPLTYNWTVDYAPYTGNTQQTGTSSSITTTIFPRIHDLGVLEDESFSYNSTVVVTDGLGCTNIASFNRGGSWVTDPCGDVISVIQDDITSFCDWKMGTGFGGRLFNAYEIEPDVWVLLVSINNTYVGNLQTFEIEIIINGVSTLVSTDPSKSYYYIDETKFKLGDEVTINMSVVTDCSECTDTITEVVGSPINRVFKPEGNQTTLQGVCEECENPVYKWQFAMGEPDDYTVVSIDVGEEIVVPLNTELIILTICSDNLPDKVYFYNG